MDPVTTVTPTPSSIDPMAVDGVVHPEENMEDGAVTQLSARIMSSSSGADQGRRQRRARTRLIQMVLSTTSEDVTEVSARTGLSRQFVRRLFAEVRLQQIQRRLARHSVAVVSSQLSGSVSRNRTAPLRRI